MTFITLSRIILVSFVAVGFGTASMAQVVPPITPPITPPTNFEDKDGPELPRLLIPPGSPEALPPKGSLVLSPNVTDEIVKELREASEFCARIELKEYVIDCLAYEYGRIASALPDEGEYAEVKEAIGQAVVKMQVLVSKNRSKTLPTGRISQGGAKPRRSARALRPVETESLRNVAAESIKIIRETQTVLIRSAENSEQRRRHFQRIVSAMDTGTILLRSI